MDNEMAQTLEKLFDLKGKIVVAEKELSVLEDQYKALKYGLIETLEESNLTSVKDAKGRTARRMADQIRASFLKENKDEALNWLRDNGYAYAVQPGVHHATLSKIIKERLDIGEPFPTGLFSYFIEKNVALIGAKEAANV